MRLGALSDRLDEQTDVAAYDGIDVSHNGLQVGHRDLEIEHVACAVDAAVEPIALAGEAGAELLVVHHGLIWGDGLDGLTGATFDRVGALYEHDLSLYACHLPLDGHPDLGNAAIIADRVGLGDVEPFGHMQGRPTGVIGRYPGGCSRADLVEVVSTAIDVPRSHVESIGDIHDEVETVAIVTGSGSDFVEDAAVAGADVLITGESKHSTYHLAREVGVDILLGGHYATETLGVRALATDMESWGLETTFVDVPTGL